MTISQADLPGRLGNPRPDGGFEDELKLELGPVSSLVRGPGARRRAPKLERRRAVPPYRRSRPVVGGPPDLDQQAKSRPAGRRSSSPARSQAFREAYTSPPTTADAAAGSATSPAAASFREPSLRAAACRIRALPVVPWPRVSSLAGMQQQAAVLHALHAQFSISPVAGGLSPSAAADARLSALQRGGLSAPRPAWVVVARRFPGVDGSRWHRR